MCYLLVAGIELGWSEMTGPRRAAAGGGSARRRRRSGGVWEGHPGSRDSVEQGESLGSGGLGNAGLNRRHHGELQLAGTNGGGGKGNGGGVHVPRPGLPFTV